MLRVLRLETHVYYDCGHHVRAIRWNGDSMSMHIYLSLMAEKDRQGGNEGEQRGDEVGDATLYYRTMGGRERWQV
jgi:hypothetical protein